MKLSQIQGDRCFEVIADLIAPVSNIAKDKEAQELFKRKAVPKGKDPKQYFIDRVTAGLPSLLKNHKDDMVIIMATLNDVSKEEYLKDLNLAKLFGDVFDVLTDDEFAAFLS